MRFPRGPFPRNDKRRIDQSDGLSGSIALSSWPVGIAERSRRGSPRPCRDTLNQRGGLVLPSAGSPEDCGSPNSQPNQGCAAAPNPHPHRPTSLRAVAPGRLTWLFRARLFRAAATVKPAKAKPKPPKPPKPAAHAHSGKPCPLWPSEGRLSAECLGRLLDDGPRGPSFSDVIFRPSTR